MLNFIKKLKANIQRVPLDSVQPGHLEQTGVSFGTSLLDSYELFRKNSLRILEVGSLHALNGQYLVRDGIHTLIGHGASGEFVIGGVRALALVFVRHPYSGTVRIWVNEAPITVVNLNAPFTFAEPIAVFEQDEARDLTVRVEILALPRHAPHCNEALLWKLLVPLNEQEHKSEAEEARANYPGTGRLEASANDETYYAKVNQEQFDAWDRHVLACGYTLEEGKALVSEAYYKRMDKVFSLLSPGASVLDIGCGFCSSEHLGALLAKYNVAKYCGHDISHDVVEHNSRMAVKSDAVLGFTQGLNTQLPYPDNHFSFVYSGHCLEHSDNLTQTFSEIKRVLQPGGTLHFFVPLTWDESPEHIYHFNPLCWALFGEKAGMRVLSVSFGPHYNPLQNDWDTEIIMGVGK